ncbi:MAG: hypothetical protein J5667_05175 [Bacteroidales bacterium]|nr:hypothetical protein [Bacteroidales bacterium]
MKKLALVILAALALCSVSCKQVEMPFTHADSDVQITSMLMWNLPFKNLTADSPFDRKESVEATITQNAPDEVGEIVFAVPRNKRTYWDLTKVTLQATLFYDLYITPGLSGQYDLTLDDADQPRLELTVKSSRTGFEKKYKVWAYIKRTDD